jgi:hypothetical protein
MQSVTVTVFARTIATWENSEQSLEKKFKLVTAQNIFATPTFLTQSSLVGTRSWMDASCHQTTALIIQSAVGEFAMTRRRIDEK